MKKHTKRFLAALLGFIMLASQLSGTGFFAEYPNTSYAADRQASVTATSLNVRSGPGTNNSIIARLDHGTEVVVVGEATASDGVLWYRIRFTTGSQTLEGYVSSQYIKFPVTYTYDSDFESYLTAQGFPESYKDSLRTLHAEYPTWVFQAEHTGLDWNDVIDNESIVGTNLVESSSISSWKSTESGAFDWAANSWPGFDGASWVAASRDIICYYMDPRNFLDETYVFQFLNHSYDSSYQTEEGLKSMLSGTFMDTSVTSSGSSSSGSSSSSSSGSTSGSSSVQTGVGPGYETGSSTSEAGSGGPGAAAQAEAETSSQDATLPQASTQSVSLEGPSLSGASLGGDGNDGLILIDPSNLPEGSVLTENAAIEPAAVISYEYGPGMDEDPASYESNGSGSSGSSTSTVTRNYSSILMDAAAQSGINPYVLASMILQEQGSGTSGSISGTVSGYEGYYNFYNIGAYAANGMTAVQRGLWYASQEGSYMRPWNSVEKSIIGGAMYYAETFTNVGQDTFYLKKFNVQGDNLYKHQYMTNVEGAAAEGAKLARAYTDEMKTQTLVFKIPIYNNMPETACAKPTVTGSPNNKLSSLTVDGYSLTPTFNMDTESYDIIVGSDVSQICINASPIDSTATISGSGVINLGAGNTSVSITVTAGNGSTRTYTINVARQGGVSPDSSSSSSSAVTDPSIGTSDDTATGGTAVGSTSGPGAAVSSSNSSSDSSSETQSIRIVVGTGPGA